MAGPYKDKEARKAYLKAYHQANKQKRAPQNRKSAIRRSEELREYICEYLGSHPCITCGEADIVVLEFDHRDRDTKEIDIADALRHRWSKKRLQTEIDKCDVLCANCHRRRTHTQMGYRSRASTDKSA